MAQEELEKMVGDEIEGANDEVQMFVDLDAQEVGLLMDDEGITGASNAYLDGHHLVFIDAISSREAFVEMECFAHSREGREQDGLLDALARRHPFGCFNQAVDLLGLRDEWFAYRDKSYRHIAAKRLKDEDVCVQDGKIVCTKKRNVSVYRYKGRKNDALAEAADR